MRKTNDNHIFLVRAMVLSNVNVVVRGQVKSKNSSLPVVVHVSEMRVLKP